MVIYGQTHSVSQNNSMSLSMWVASPVNRGGCREKGGKEIPLQKEKTGIRIMDSPIKERMGKKELMGKSRSSTNDSIQVEKAFFGTVVFHNSIREV